MTTTSRPLRRLAAMVLACFVATTAPLPVQAGKIDDEMLTLYNGITGLPGDVAKEVKDSTQVMGPTAISGQSYHTVMGGSVMTRVPVRTIQPLAIDMPRFSAGCGGIDAYTGSISFISAKEFVDFLKATAMNAVGVTTQLAISAITPLLGHTLQNAQKIVNDINNFNKNSCEVANNAVGAVSDQFYGSEMKDCMFAARANGDDAQGAVDRCKDRQKANEAIAKVAEKAPELVAFKGNLVWEALMKLGEDQFSAEERFLIMGLLGTVIYGVADPTGEQGNKPKDPPPTFNGEGAQSITPMPVYIPPTVDTIAHILGGNTAKGTSDDVNAQGVKQIELSMFECDENDGCTKLKLNTGVKVTSLTDKVSHDLLDIVDRIRERRPLTVREVSIINNNRLPVWKMLTIGTAGPRKSGMAELLIDNFKEVIAAEYAYMMLNRTINAGLGAMQKLPNLIGSQLDDRKVIVDRGHAKLAEFSVELRAIQEKYGNLNDVNTLLDSLERQLRSQMPQQVVDLLSPPGIAG